MMNEFNLNKKYNWETAHNPIVKTYKAILTQSGTNAPVPTVLVNTLGEGITIDWTYSAVGSYVGTLTKGEFDITKTYVQIEAGYYAASYFIFAGVNPASLSTITVESEDAAAANINIAGTAYVEITIH